MAVTHADSLLHLQENLDSKEMPAEWKWPLSWEMERHMQRVVAERKAKAGVEDDDEDTETPPEWDDETAEMWRR